MISPSEADVRCWNTRSNSEGFSRRTDLGKVNRCMKFTQTAFSFKTSSPQEARYRFG